MTIVTRLKKVLLIFIIAIIALFAIVVYRIQVINDILKQKNAISELHTSLSLLRCENIHDDKGFVNREALNSVQKSAYTYKKMLSKHDHESLVMLRYIDMNIEEMLYIKTEVDEGQLSLLFREELQKRYHFAESRILHAIIALNALRDTLLESQRFKHVYSILIMISFIGYILLWYGLSIVAQIRIAFDSLSAGIDSIRKGTSEKTLKGNEFEELTVVYHTIYELTKSLNESYDEIYHMASFPQLDPNPVLEIAPDARILYANSAAKMIMNRFGADVLLPEDIRDVISEIQDQSLVQALRREVSAGESIYELSLYKPFDIDAIRVYAIDVTERYTAERKFANVTRMYRFLSRVNHAVAFAVDTEEMFDMICKAAVEQGHFLASLYYRAETALPLTQTYALRRSIENEQMFIQELLSYHEPKTHNKGVLKIYNRVENTLLRAHECGSIAIIPVKYENTLMGELFLCAEEERFFTKDEVELLERITHDIGFAIVYFKKEQDSKIMRDELIKSESRYKSIFEKSKAAMLLINPEDGTIVDCNDAAIQFYGYSKEAFCTKTIFEITAGEPEEVTREMSNALLEKRNYFLFEHILSNGTVRKVETYSGNILVHDSVYLFSIIHDVTDKYRAEEEIRVLNADLERRINDRTAELHAYAKELESFSYSVSHDLRAPLRSIAGFSKFLQEDYSKILDDQGKDYLKRIHNGVEKMNELIENLLNLSRITRSDLVMTPVNLSEKARDILQELRAENPEREYEFQIEDDIIVEADSRLISIALTNLLNNAWKYTSKTKKSVITVKKIVKDTVPVIMIQDNGAGFDMRYSDKLFGVFQRLHGGGEFPGTGIGLAIVHRIILRHGGSIWAEAEPEKGAIFYFTIGVLR